MRSPRLALSGYHHLDDLRWRADPDNRGNVDHLVIGPSGVYVVDAKNWAGRIEVRGRQVLQDGVPRDDRPLALRSMTIKVEEVMHAQATPTVRNQSSASPRSSRGSRPRTTASC